MIKKFNEEKDKELKRLKDSEKEKELEIEKKTEILKNLKLQQKSRKQFLMIDQISNGNIEKNLNTPKNLKNPLSKTISKSIKLSTPQIEENNILYKSRRYQSPHPSAKGLWAAEASSRTRGSCRRGASSSVVPPPIRR